MSSGGCLQAAETNKSLRGHRTEAAPRIDGVLDESAWAEADTAVGFSNFDQPDVMAGDQTIGRVLFDDEAIYVGPVFRWSLLMESRGQRELAMGGGGLPVRSPTRTAHG